MCASINVDWLLSSTVYKACEILILIWCHFFFISKEVIKLESCIGADT